MGNIKRYSKYTLLNNNTLLTDYTNTLRHIFSRVIFHQVDDNTKYKFQRYLLARKAYKRIYILDNKTPDKMENYYYQKLFIVDSLTNVTTLSLYFNEETLRNNKISLSSTNVNKQITIEFAEGDLSKFLGMIPIYTKYQILRTEFDNIKYLVDEESLFPEEQNFIEYIKTIKQSK